MVGVKREKGINLPFSKYAQSIISYTFMHYLGTQYFIPDDSNHFVRSVDAGFNSVVNTNSVLVRPAMCLNISLLFFLFS